MGEYYVIFGRNGCPYTEDAKKRAKELNIKHVYYNIPNAKSKDIPEQFMKLINDNNHTTVPCVFKLSFVGGSSDFANLLDNKKYEEYLPTDYSSSAHKSGVYSSDDESKSGFSSNDEY